MLAEAFADAVSFANEVEEGDVLENEKGAAVKNPNVDDDRRLFQKRFCSFDWDSNIPVEEKPCLLDLSGPVELDCPAH